MADQINHCIHLIRDSFLKSWVLRNWLLTFSLFFFYTFIQSTSQIIDETLNYLSVGFMPRFLPHVIYFIWKLALQYPIEMKNGCFWI